MVFLVSIKLCVVCSADRSIDSQFNRGMTYINKKSYINIKKEESQVEKVVKNKVL